jgi:hypothetical protein
MRRNLFTPVAAFVLGIVTLFAPAVQAQGPRPDCYVLSVGVDHYQARNVPNLQGCVNDARGMAAVFQHQGGTRFGRVQARTLTDGQATRPNIERGLQWLERSGQAGDFVVLFVSGHGDRAPHGWAFLPHDFDPANEVGTALSGQRMLALADRLASAGKKVFIVVDACFAGQLRQEGAAVLRRHRDAQSGGVALLLSSGANQTSTTINNQFSAFARGLTEGLSGRADANGDGQVTVQEASDFAVRRARELCRQAGRRTQDGEAAWSLSVSGSLALAQTRPLPGSLSLTRPRTVRDAGSDLRIAAGVR